MTPVPSSRPASTIGRLSIVKAPEEFDMEKGELPPLEPKMWDAYSGYMEDLIINNQKGANDELLCKEYFDIKIQGGPPRQVAVFYDTNADAVIEDLVCQLNAAPQDPPPVDPAPSPPTFASPSSPSSSSSLPSPPSTPRYQVSEFCLVERNEMNELERLISGEEYILAIVLSWEVPEKMSFVLKRVTPKLEERRKSQMPVRIRQTRHILARQELIKDVQTF